MKVLPQASAKKKTERLKGFKFRIFVGHFFSSDVMAVKGLKLRVRRALSVSSLAAVGAESNKNQRETKQTP